MTFDLSKKQRGKQNYSWKYDALFGKTSADGLILKNTNQDQVCLEPYRQNCLIIVNVFSEILRGIDKLLSDVVFS